MTLIGSRLGLKHRCTIERDTHANSSAWGDPPVPDWQPLTIDLACRAWAVTGREAADAKQTVLVEEIFVLCALGTDVTERDRLDDITYRGTVIFSGPIGIRAILTRADHLELLCVRL